MRNELPTLENLILDMDGVLWRGETPMPGLVDFFATLHELGIHFVLATNNATKVATQYTEKLARFGVDVAPDRIMTSAEATASYLSGEYPPGTSAYVVGDAGLQLAMRENGFEVLPANGFIGDNARSELVVVGFSRHVCYDQLASAAYLLNNGARFVATNPDATFPSEHGPVPGAGAFIAFLSTATGKTPTIIGKPSPAIFEEAMERLGGTPANTAMVGDRLETDIMGAKTAGLHTILLLSGVTRQEKVESSDIQPDLILPDIMALGQYLAGQKNGAMGVTSGKDRDVRL